MAGIALAVLDLAPTLMVWAMHGDGEAYLTSLLAVDMAELASWANRRRLVLLAP